MEATALDRTTGLDLCAVVGDLVDYEQLEVEHDGVHTAVVAVLPRASTLQRSAVDGTSLRRVIAANVDVAFLCTPFEPGINIGRLERMIAIARAGGITPIVTLTKSDLSPDLEPDVGAVRAAIPGVDLLTVSALDAADDVRANLLAIVKPEVIAVFFGPSGAGKSTLVNALVENHVQDVQQTRGSGYGRHTTTASVLLEIREGGAIIDTPGVRTLGIAGGVEAVESAFADLIELAASCRFPDCGHASEPGCAITAAIDNGELDARRLVSWRKLDRETLREQARTDARARQQLGDEWRRRGKQQRDYYRANPKGR